MTKESLKESVRRIVDYEDVPFIKAVCEYWADKNGIKKVDRRHKAGKNVYDMWIDGGDSRISFIVYDDWRKEDYGYCCEHTRLAIIMRKRGGNYIIITRSLTGDRIIEIDRTGYEWHYDYDELRKLIDDYPDLFDGLGVKE